MPHVQKGLPDEKKFGGSLTTTFLLAMANPMIALPVERICKPENGNVKPFNIAEWDGDDVQE